MNKRLKEDWETRSKEFKDNAKGVMFATFPPQINEMFHAWEVSILEKHFPQKKQIQVLDIGAGYGRLSIPLAKKFKNAFFQGIDISEGYVNLFNKRLGKQGKAVYGDLSKLPYKANTFDYVFMVTVLMYLTDKEIKTLLKEVQRVTKKDAKIVIIENNESGHNYITGYGLLSTLKKITGKQNSHFVRSRVFHQKEIEDMLESDFVIQEKSGCSAATVVIPLALVGSKLGILKNSIKLNGDIHGLPTLYEAFVLEKK